MAPLQLGIFLLASAGIIYVSRASLRPPRSHGFYRFWAWEAILALAVLNAPVWFREPFAWHRIISSLLLLAWGVFFKAPSWPGIVLAAAATGFLVGTAKIEERENVRFFGPSYESYMKRTRMFTPFVL